MPPSPADPATASAMAVLACSYGPNQPGGNSAGWWWYSARSRPAPSRASSAPASTCSASAPGGFAPSVTAAQAPPCAATNGRSDASATSTWSLLSSGSAAGTRSPATMRS
ncbi:hypothetical protein ACFQZ4_39080 [Catellatospora coxensis]